MKMAVIARASEWWEYKLPPILAVGYLILFHPGPVSLNHCGALIMVLLSLVTGATYVSMLNDATDVADDAAAGKKNALSGFGTLQRACMVMIPLLTGAGFTAYFAADQSSMLLYICCYLCFTLYSLPPFRLKRRGMAGIMADAAGSQLFPTLFIAVFLLYKTGQAVHYYQLICMGAWSFCWGLRGILWHQFQDLDNDIRSGTHTMVRNMSRKRVSITGTLLFCMELAACAVLFVAFKLVLPAVVLAAYMVYLIGLHKRWHVAIILIRPTRNRYRICMNEYYQVLLPLSILLSVAVSQPAALLVFVTHVALFPRITIRICNEGYRLLTNKPRVGPVLRSPAVSSH